MIKFGHQVCRFWAKYNFPVHFIIIFNRFLKYLSCLIGAIWIKVLLRMNRCEYGKNLKVDGKVIVQCNKVARIKIGSNCRINSRFGSNLVGRTNPTVLQCVDEGQISIGDHSGISFAIISSRRKINIGKHVNIGGNVRIFDHNYHSLDFMERRDGALDRQGCRVAPIRIGNDVFIGTNSIILKGVSIGDRSIIGAGSVVSCNIPADEIWAGNPARKVKALPLL